MLWLCPLTGAAIKKPRSLARSGFSLSTFGPALPEPRQTAGSGACLHRVDLLHVNTLSALSCESEMLAGTGGTEGYGWESGRLQIAAAPGATKRGAGRNRISRGSGKKPPLGLPSAGDGARTAPSAGRPFRTVARGTPHSWDSPLRPPSLFCRLLLLSGRVHQRAVSRARAPWSVTPCLELSRRVPSMPNSKFILPRCNTVRP